MAKPLPIAKLTEPDGPLRDSAGVLMVRLQEMLDLAIPSHVFENVQDLHDMRIAAKRLRYTLEIFAPVMPARGSNALLTKVTEVQERIGAIHDCDVLFPLLRETMEQEMEREHRAAQKRGVGPPPYLAAEGLAALTARKRAERAELYQEFLGFWDALPPEKLATDLSLLLAGPENAEKTAAAEAGSATPPKKSRKKSSTAADEADPGAV